MRDWSLRVGNPLSLVLSADMRHGSPDYLNDHIWELEFGAGEPAGLAVHTTYGLRARTMRLFYRFTEMGRTVASPAEFHAPLQLVRFYANFLMLNFSPFEGLEITAEYWVPESHALAGRLTFANRTAFTRKLNFELCGSLTPLEGIPLTFTQQQMVNVLAGQSGGLSPVLFMTGGPRPGPGPHPSLALDLDFDPGLTRSLTWSVAAEPVAENSFELARRIVALPWDAGRARLELQDAADVLDIHTGDEEWDAAFAFSQRAAMSLFFPAGEHLPFPSFVRARQPDQGHSDKGDGLDYSPSWSGQSPFDALYLSSLLPVARQLTRGLIENFLSVQAPDGSIDGKPGLGGQRLKLLSAPLLAGLAWNYYQDAGDDSFLARVYPGLLSFFKTWFSPERDPDQDGIPAWEHVLQTGFEDHPLFDVWQPWSQGVDISALFNPELEALLYREVTCLILMAEKLGRSDDLGPLHQQAALLRTSVEAGWNARNGLYGYRDRLTLRSSSGKPVGKLKGSGDLRLGKIAWEHPARLLVEVQTKGATPKKPVVEIYGLAEGGEKESEVIKEDRFHWRGNGSVACSQKVYASIDRIAVSGLDDKDRVSVRTVDTTLEDITLFTPLWAHTPEPQRAKLAVTRSLFDAGRFGRPFGAPLLPASPDPQAEALAMSVHFPWNQMLGEALLSYGLRNEAAILTVHMMNAAILCLKQNQAFYEHYNAETGSGIGERGALTGFAPVGLFLQVLGVNILSPSRVRLEGKNPFAWPVTILYRGLRVARGMDSTEVTFLNGKTVTITDPAPCIVSL